MGNAEVVQRITAAVTPAVMVSACGLLALGLDNQAARMSTRLRDLAKEYRSLEVGEGRAKAIRDETQTLARRHGLYALALLCNYAALLMFLLTSAVALWVDITQLPVLPLLLFAAGVLLLGVMTVCALLSVRLSRRAIVLEERDVMTSIPPRPPRPEG
jgi:uncharacterized membrane protein